MKLKLKELGSKLDNDNVYVLHLDKDFDPIDLDMFTVRWKKFVFPGGEPHIKIVDIPEEDAPLVITHRFNTVSDIFDIILATDAARRVGYEHISLVLPYFPGARQDRVCNEGEPLTIKVFADLINDCCFDEVAILCPHSEVTPALINNVTVYDEHGFAEEIVRDHLKNDPNLTTINIICPDAGAGKRVGGIAKFLIHKFENIEFNLIRCEKERNVATGEIKGFYIQAADLGGYPGIIFDDIVAYGGTFLGLADILRNKNCGHLSIFVGHADCLKGIENLLTKFDKVYTTNSKQDWDLQISDDKLKIIKFKL